MLTWGFWGIFLFVFKSFFKSHKGPSHYLPSSYKPPSWVCQWHPGRPKRCQKTKWLVLALGIALMLRLQWVIIIEALVWNLKDTELKRRWLVLGTAGISPDCTPECAYHSSASAPHGSAAWPHGVSPVVRHSHPVPSTHRERQTDRRSSQDGEITSRHDLLQ